MLRAASAATVHDVLQGRNNWHTQTWPPGMYSIVGLSIPCDTRTMVEQAHPVPRSANISGNVNDFGVESLVEQLLELVDPSKTSTDDQRVHINDLSWHGELSGYEVELSR